mmetsp:Transcript_18143/g.37768  ORF Transcript_18143/g.37768 Transcript_18143/m.37768 type:complete len:484 (-) Transcript_18143:273-1724(-)
MNVDGPVRDVVLTSVVAVAMLTHLVLTPFTKVEESFNTQATHDILEHGSELSFYDHLSFPGVVPRTFLGALAVAIVSWPFRWCFSTRWREEFGLVWTRIVLGGAVVWSLRGLRRAVRRKFGRDVEGWFAVVLSVQPHLMFYGSRMLPNTFGLVLSNWALAWVLDGKGEMGLCMLAVGTALFRSELAIYTAVTWVVLVLRGEVSPGVAVARGVAAACLAAVLSVLVDSILWGRWLWPELEVFYFNTILNKSSQWGTAPWYWYWTSAVPRALAATLLLIPLGIQSFGHRLTSILLPAVLYISVYSFLPHKELRFIFYTLPALSVASATGYAVLWRGRQKSILRSLAFAVLGVGSILLTLAVTGVFLAASHWNYPGGYAMRALHQQVRDQSAARWVHIDVQSAMTGISRFCELRQPDLWHYSKDESQTLESLSTSNFTHLISAHPYVSSYQVIHTELCFVQVDWFHLRLVTQPCLYVHQHHTFPDH